MPVLFNHRVDYSYPNIMHGLAGYHFYGMRALSLSKPKDTVQLHPALKIHWDDINGHFTETGIVHTTNIEWDIDESVAKKYPDHKLSVYQYTKEFHDIIPNNNMTELEARFNDKNEFVKICKELNIPEPKTEIYDRAGDIKPEKLDYPVVIKGAEGVQGLEVHICETEEEATAAIHALGPDVPAQTQDYVEADFWGTVNFRINEDGSIRRRGITIQIIDDKRHMGNRGCPWHDVWGIFEPFAEYMAKTGYVADFGIDIAFTRDAVYAIECNSRFPGSTYPMIIANELGFTDRWLSRNIILKNPSLDLSAIDDLLYKPGRTSGAVIYYWALPARKITPVILGSRDEQDEIYSELVKKLGGKDRGIRLPS